ncbi:MAG: benzoyl-CoA reductase subunit C [Desulfitobacteriaceae bacterium]
MNSREVIQRCQELYEDLDFNYVKEWKERTGGGAIGLFPIYVTKEIIHAAGALPIEIYGGSDLIEVVKGDSFYQSYICHIPRSTVDMGMTGKLDPLDGMIWPFTCDVVRNLTGVWKLLFPEKYSKFFDQPQNFDQEIGGEYLVGQFKEIISDVEKITGQKVTTEKLNQSIALYNENRRLLSKLYEARAEEPWQVPTDEIYLLMRAGSVLEVSEFNQMIKDYLETVDQLNRKPEDKVRVIVSGAFCEQPSISLIRAMELAGCYIVDDDFVLGNRCLDSDVEIGNEPLKAIASAYLKSRVPSSSRYEGDTPKTKRLVQQVKDRKAEGVIFASPSFCDAALQDQPFHQQGMDKEGIRHISFQYSEDTSQFGSIREQIGTFTDSIKLWEA